jgi:hypothetical protein
MYFCYSERKHSMISETSSWSALRFNRKKKARQQGNNRRTSDKVNAGSRAHRQGTRQSCDSAQHRFLMESNCTLQEPESFQASELGQPGN